MQPLQTKQLSMLREIDRLCEEYDIPYLLVFGTLIGAVRHQGFIPWDDDIDIAMRREDYERFATIAHYLPDNYVLQTHDTEPEYFLSFPKVRDTTSSLQELALAHMNISTGPWIDIFIYDKIPGDPQLAKQQFDEVKALHTRLHRNVFIYAARDETGPRATVKRVLHWFNKRRFTSSRNREMFESIYDQLQVALTRYANTDSNVYQLLCTRRTNDERTKHRLTAKDFLAPITGTFEGLKVNIPARYDEILTEQYGDYMSLPPEAERKSVHNF